MRNLILFIFLSSLAFSQAYVKTPSGRYVKLYNQNIVGDSITISASASVDTNVIATKYFVSQQSGGSSDIVLQLPADTTTGANTTPINLRSMVFTYEANSTYIFDIYMIGNSAAATTGWGLQIDLSSAVTLVALRHLTQIANTGTITGGFSIADDASVAVSSAMGATNGANVPVTGSGLLITGANTGTAQFRLRSETAAATTAKAGSTIIVRKVK